MPTYEYQCSKCNAQFDLRRSFTEVEQPAVCPSCGGEARKLFSLFASEGRGKVRVPEKEAFRG